jgi:hypothetical protein
LQAFVETWVGAIHLNAGNFLGKGAMSLEQMPDCLLQRDAGFVFSLRLLLLNGANMILAGRRSHKH